MFHVGVKRKGLFLISGKQVLCTQTCGYIFKCFVYLKVFYNNIKNLTSPLEKKQFVFFIYKTQTDSCQKRSQFLIFFCPLAYVYACKLKMHKHDKHSTAHALAVKIQDMGRRIHAFYFYFKTVIAGTWLSIQGMPAEEEELTPTLGPS